LKPIVLICHFLILILLILLLKLENLLLKKD
jgi:hypothetical protein